MRFLVIPTNRPERLAGFFEAWKDKGGWDEIIVVEDNLDRCDVTGCPRFFRHYSWKHIDRILGPKDSWIISRKDSAIRAFGFLAAYHLGATEILTLDDDCYPTDREDAQSQPTFFQRHINYMGHPAWISSVSDGQRVRGMPYVTVGHLLSDINIGLWENVGDWDSIQGRPDGYYKPPRYENRIIPAGQLAPMCGMNLCFRRDVTPLMYFPLMGSGPNGEDWKYRRFDDIWAGIIAKLLMDKCGLLMSAGEPFVNHTRASNAAENKIKEAPGIEANEKFWVSIRDAAKDIQPAAPSVMVRQLGRVLFDINPRGEYEMYLKTLGRALIFWAALFHTKLAF